MFYQFHDIPNSKNWVQIKPILKGWSDDKKYFIQTKEGHKYLLRISKKEKLDEEAVLYDALLKLSKKDLPISKLLESGYCNEGKNTYRLFTWVDGSDADIQITHLPTSQQYQLGLEAGHILRQIHSIPAPPSQKPWAEHFNWKIDRNIRLYQKCPLSFQNADKVIDFLNTHRYLLEDRPQSFHHGDFHLRNMLLNEKGALGIIDFNRLDFGDPWEEFNRIIWCASKSKWFASGRINGYFNDAVPNDFFKLMAIYIASNQLSSLPWALNFGEEEVKTLTIQVKKIMEWYQDFEEYIPSWYQKL